MTSLTQEHRHKAVWGARNIPGARDKVTWGFRGSAVALSFACALAFATDAAAAGHGRRFPKMDRDLEARAVTGNKKHKTTVIVTLAPGTDVPPALHQYSRFGRLNGISGHVLDIPDSELQHVANLSQTVHVHPDAAVHGLDFRTDVTSGAFFVGHNIGLTGAGITIAVLDSGIAKEHDDLPASSLVYFKDFVNQKTKRYDDFGHGTHVAGIIAGKGRDSKGEMSGTAPGAKLVVLKVLDKDGNGTVANVIAALDWLSAYGPSLGVRVVNMSFGAKPTEQPEHDPLALAAKALVDRGIVVVAAAGNNGQYDGKKVWGGIPSPADAPWVLTVGASSTLGTVTRKDDKMAAFSSRGPAVGRIAKPDLVASGVGTVSTISSEGSKYEKDEKFLVKAPCRLGLCPNTLFTPYMSMSGTSMSAPVVTGAVALMLQANPNLTPNLVKAILQYTAELHSGYNALEQGAGFLNALGAVRLAQFYATGQLGTKAPVSPAWSRHIFWGNHRLTGGIMSPKANAWKNGVLWGAIKSSGGDDNIVWGTDDSSDNIVWGTSGGDDDNIVWRTEFGDDNIVWGTDCGGADCGDNIVWGTDDDDNIVWGTDDDSDNLVWGTSDDDNLVWGTSDDDNLVWGTSDDDDNIVWGTDDGGDNIVWGTGFTLPTLTVTLPKDPGYGWFLNFKNDQRWILVEFGESFTIPAVTKGKRR